MGARDGRSPIGLIGMRGRDVKARCASAPQTAILAGTAGTAGAAARAGRARRAAGPGRAGF